MTKTVLVVDDDKMLRDALACGLRKYDFDVIIAESAKDAGNILERISVNAIVLDRMMNGTDGLSFLKNIRAQGNNTPVIMLTAMSGPENAIDGLSNGANDYMSKPFKLQELILRLNNIIKNAPKSDKSGDFDGLIMVDNEFFVCDKDGNRKLLSLSNEEKKVETNIKITKKNVKKTDEELKTKKKKFC